ITSEEENHSLISTAPPTINHEKSEREYQMICEIHDAVKNLPPLVTEVTDSGEDPVEFVFQEAGTSWKVIFEGSEPFHVKDCFGAKYVNWLLHNHGKTVSALELEQFIRPEKADIRDANGERGGNSSEKLKLGRK